MGRENQGLALFCRRVPDLLGAVFHLQHHGRDVQQTELALSAGGGGFSPHHLAGVYEQFCESSHLYHIQSGV